MKQSGRASLLTLLAIAAVFLVGGMLLFSRESLSSIGDRFLKALAAGDVDTLTEMTYLDGDSKEDMRKQWDFAVNKAGRYYYFGYLITGSKEISPDSAQVTVQFVKDANRPGSFATKYEIPLVKVDNEWKVDAKSLTRDMFPALPR